MPSNTNEEPVIGNLSLSTKMINNVLENGEENTLWKYKSNSDSQNDANTINEEQADGTNISQFARNLYVEGDQYSNNSQDLSPTEQQEEFLKKSQELMKAIKKGEVSATDSEKQHIEKPKQISENEIGSNRFNTTKEKKKSEKSSNQGSIIDALFSPFSWFMGGGGEKPKVESSEKPTLATVRSQEEKKAKSDEKTSDSSIFSSILPFFSSSKKQTSTSTRSESEQTAVIKKKRRNNALSWIERFGADAGKAASNALKDPLERLASSPVLATGEVLVVHSLDVESIDLRRIFKYFLYMVLTWRFSQTLFGGIIPAILGLNERRRALKQQVTPVILPISSQQIEGGKSPAVTYIPKQ